MPDELDEDDRRMLDELHAAARARRRRLWLQWILILVPGIPVVWLATIYLGFLIGGLALAGVVAWGLAVQKLLPAPPPP